MKKNLLFFVLLFFSSQALLYAQVEKRIDRSNGNPKYIKFSKSFQFQGSGDQLLSQMLNLDPAEAYKLRRTQVENPGEAHYEYQQYYQGVKVEYGRYKVHYKNSRPFIMSGDRYEVTGIDVTPTISGDAALQNALGFMKASQNQWDEDSDVKRPEAELVIVPKFITNSKEEYLKPTLAYKLDIYTKAPLRRDYVYVDANTGDIIHSNPIIKHVHDNDTDAPANGSASTRYSGTINNFGTDSNGGNFRLRDYSRGNGIETYDMNTSTNYNNAVDFVDNDNNWTSSEWNNAAKDNGALDAHWGAQMTYDYFLTMHNRNSYDNNGATIRSYVHFDSNYDNAFWDGIRMTYGDGSVFDILTSLDVAAHEIGHAVCSSTADLVYQRESGALNEGFSDIWAAAVEAFAAPNKQIWQIGEDIDLRSGSNGLRSMSNPNSAGDPDTYGGTYWVNPQCGTPVRSNDYCGVHTNSGVLNHWFYLLSDGGSGTNDIGSSFTVSGIGVIDAAKIAYRTEAVYLGQTSDFADARTFSIQSAIDIFGAGSAQEIATTNAWYAVGVGSEYCTSNCTNYCASTGNNVSDEYIGRVQLNTIDNASSATGGYADFTNISTDLSRSGEYTITITPTWTGTVYQEGYAVWIDFNQNGSFDTSERVYSQSATTNTPVSGTFTVPSTASEGTTRMRVSMKYNGTPTSCESFSYGEVEDYTINIVASGGDTQAPSAPQNLSASNITQTTVDLSWSASTDNVGVTGYDVSLDGNLLGTTANTSAQITGLTAGTQYTFSVTAKDNAGNISAPSNSLSVTTSGSGGGTPTSQTLFEGSFETGMEGWVDGGSDCYRFNNTTAAYDGTYSIRLRDNSGVASSMTLQNLDVAGFDNININFVFYPNSMENGEDFFVRYYDGNSWSTIASYASGTHFNNGSHYTVDLDISSANYSFPSNAQIRIQCDASANADQIYVDQMMIVASSGSTVASLVGSSTIAMLSTDPVNTGILDSGELEQDDPEFNFYPNPVDNSATITGIEVDETTLVHVRVYNMQGQTLKTISWNQEEGNLQKNIKLKGLKKGIYYLEITTNDGQQEIRRFLKE